MEHKRHYACKNISKGDIKAPCIKPQVNLRLSLPCWRGWRQKPKMKKVVIKNSSSQTQVHIRIIQKACFTNTNTWVPPVPFLFWFQVWSGVCILIRTPCILMQVVPSSTVWEALMQRSEELLRISAPWIRTISNSFPKEFSYGIV